VTTSSTSREGCYRPSADARLWVRLSGLKSGHRARSETWPRSEPLAHKQSKIPLAEEARFSGFILRPAQYSNFRAIRDLPSPHEPEIYTAAALATSLRPCSR